MGESLIFKARLFKDTVDGAGCQVVGGLAGYRHTAGFGLVLKLTMTSATGDLQPTVIP